MVTGRDFFLFQVINCLGSLVISYQTQKRKDETLCVQFCTIKSSSMKGSKSRLSIRMPAVPAHRHTPVVKSRQIGRD